MTIAAALDEATALLQRNGVADARREAVSLMIYTTNKHRAFLIAHSDEELAPDKTVLFDAAVRRRASREPFQYIVGKQEFCGSEFEVRRGVLIPRPETEMLVSALVDRLQNVDSPRFLEIGIGTGCIAISVLRLLPGSVAIGTDISQESAGLAEINATRLGVKDRFDIKVGDLFSPVEGMTFDAIISNPPYVPAVDLAALQSEVRDFEPLAALTDGGDGLSIIKTIVEAAPKYVVPGGYLLLEFGYGQSDPVARMFDRTIWASVDLHKDFRSIVRMVVAQLA